ncbi:MFS transporter [Winogradskyella bathintestinalis]|uniref:MFS transporter n=1 Tax=Winogradskyella bathintestinalis TaxID=3035208 RepID=A0ABT7ZU38_9FLAO|nr:MFS transporter [Winogradskyella bathintestinalis]MDN3492530.1 MFS transporter [Winogradskyella bathintestinalis]
MKTQTKSRTTKRVLPIIIFSQFCCTSIWFAGNSVIEDLIAVYNLNPQSLGYLSASVQFGFIVGTLIFAILTLSDRFSPSKIFFTCALLGAGFNLGMLYSHNTISTLLCFRFLTGFSLAGIYPVGMKIAADHFKKGLGKSVSFLVAALVLGTAFPHFIKSLGLNFDWKIVVWTTSIMALIGGLLIFMFVKNGPYQKLASKFEITKIIKIFKNNAFRAAAFGYFGHMWELYAFWTFLPVLLISYCTFHNIIINVYLLIFTIIASGAIACVLSGIGFKIYGIKKTAMVALCTSGLCCLLSPLFFIINSSILFIAFLIIWGMAVIADSPLFSTMVAQNSNSKSKGTALTIVNCIGFAITIVSIQLINLLIAVEISIQYVFLILAIGPAVGLIYLRKT